jgi:hypothetical protein
MDTGSPYCLFQAALGRSLGLQIEDGIRHEISGIVAGASVPGYFHKVLLSIEDHWTVDIMAGFVDGMGAGILLGRRGFFDNFVVKFDHCKIPPSFEIDRILWPT